MELPQREDLGFKTDVPSLDGAIPRPSLVDRLREGRARAQWLHGPAGSGKSTLAAAYARDAEVPFVWYRLDERDDDPAFFYAAVRATLSSGSTSGS